MTPPASEPAPKRWAAFAVCVAVAIVTILDLVKVNVTLTPIEHTLGASSSDAQLIVAGYVLAFGIALVPAGRLGDVWNRKAMFIIGLLAFTLASAWCALAWSGSALVAARLLQGVAAGILMPQAIGLIQQLFQGQERGEAFGLFGAAIGLGTAFGPTVGGLLVGTLGEDLGWRWTFGMNVPLALLILPFAIRLLPARQLHAPGNRGRDLDLVGVALMAVTVLALMFPFVTTSGTGADSPARWWTLAGAAIAAAAFVAWERRYLARGRAPVIEFSLFRLPSYRYGVIVTTLWFAVMPPTFLVVTLYAQQGLGHAALAVGLITVPYAIVSAVVAAVSGRYTFRHAATLVALGIVVFIAGVVAVIGIGMWADADLTPLALAIALGVAGIGPGLIMSANQMRTVKHVPLVSAGVAGSFMQVGQRLGTAIGLAVATSVYFASVAQFPDDARRAFVTAMLLVLALAFAALAVALVDLRAHLRERARDDEPGSVASTR